MRLSRFLIAPISQHLVASVATRAANCPVLCLGHTQTCTPTREFEIESPVRLDCGTRARSICRRTHCWVGRYGISWPPGCRCSRRRWCCHLCSLCNGKAIQRPSAANLHLDRREWRWRRAPRGERHSDGRSGERRARRSHQSGASARLGRRPRADGLLSRRRSSASQWHGRRSGFADAPSCALLLARACIRHASCHSLAGVQWGLPRACAKSHTTTLPQSPPAIDVHSFYSIALHARHRDLATRGHH